MRAVGAELSVAEREQDWARVCDLCSRGLDVDSEWLHDYHLSLFVKVISDLVPSNGPMMLLSGCDIP